MDRRILDATEPDAAAVIAVLAGEVREWAGLDVALALDDCQDLPEDSARVLADLGTRLPPGVVLQCGIQDPSDFGSPLALLRAAHADAELIVSPIAEEGIAEAGVVGKPDVGLKSSPTGWDGNGHAIAGRTGVELRLEGFAQPLDRTGP